MTAVLEALPAAPAVKATHTKRRKPLAKSAQAKQAELELKLDQVRDQLTESVRDLVTGQDWLRAMAFATRFRKYSFSNSMLIYAQHAAAYEAGIVTAPEPTLVAGYGTWKKLGRHVRKGVSGYQILAPRHARFASFTPHDESSWRPLGYKERPKEGETVTTKVRGMTVTYVWDISGTDGDPLPVQPMPQLLQGEAPAGLWEGITGQIRAHGFTVSDAANAAELKGADGVTRYTTNEVAVRADMSELDRCSVAIHELAHVMQLDTTPPAELQAHRGVTEVEADTVAMMVLAAHGIDSSTSTVPYVADWAMAVPGQDPVEVVHAAADQVRSMALAILDKIDTHQGLGGKAEDLIS